MITSWPLLCEATAVDSNSFAVLDEALSFFNSIVKAVGANGLGVLDYTVGADDNDVPFIFAAIEPSRGSATTVC